MDNLRIMAECVGWATLATAVLAIACIVWEIDLIVLTSVGRAVLASQHARRILSEAVVGGG